MLFVVKERLEGLNATLVLGEGWGYTGGGDRCPLYVKRGLFYGSASTLLSPFCPSFEVAGEKNAGYFPTDEHPQKW